MISRPSKRILALALASIPIAARCAAGEAPSDPPRDEAALIAIVQSAAPHAQRAEACKQLAVAGTAKAVPALAALLGDAKLAHMARYALEPMPDPAAGAALRDAMERLKGELRVGAINSIGARRDREAVGALAKLLDDADASVAAAATAALGRIGTDASAKTLETALAKASPERRAEVGDACQRCINELIATGENVAAIRLADAVRATKDLPEPALLAATRGAIVARGAEGAGLLVEQLRSAEWPRFALGLRLAREIPGEGITRALIDALGELAPDRRPALLATLADRGDRAAVPAVLQMADGDSPAERVAAIRALARLGNANVVAALAKIAGGGPADIAREARAALIALDGPTVEPAILALLAAQEATARTLAADVARERIMTEAVPGLRQLAVDPDEGARGAAIAALGQCGGADEIPFLADRLIQVGAAREAALAQAALRSTIARLPDRKQVSEKLASVLPHAKGAARAALVGLLGAAGGPNALDVVRAALNDPDPMVKEAATRALSEWGNPDAAPELLRLAKELPDERERVLTLRGYLGLAASPSLDDPQRSEMCGRALEAAARDEERRLALGVLGSLSDAGALDLTLARLENPALKNEAGAAIVGILQNQARLWPNLRLPRARQIEALEKVAGQCDDPQVLQQARAKLDEIRPPQKKAPGKTKG